MSQDSHDQILREAEKLAANGHLEAAVEAYRHAVDRAPKDTNTLNRLGDLLARVDRLDEAIAVYRRIADHFASDGFFLKAIAVYKKMARLDPGQTDVYEKLASLYFKQGLVVEGRQQLLTLAEYFLELGKPREAARVYRVLTELEPSNDRVRGKLARLKSDYPDLAANSEEPASHFTVPDNRSTNETENSQPAEVHGTADAARPELVPPSTWEATAHQASKSVRMSADRTHHGSANQQEAPLASNRDRDSRLSPGSVSPLTEVGRSTRADADDNELQGPRALEVLVAALREEVARLSSMTASTIVIPSEGAFQLIKPLVGFKHEIELKLTQYYYPDNVFVMMKFRESNQMLGEFIIECLRRHGLRGVRADQPEWNITRNVYNPIAVLYCCKYGIALFDEPEEHQAYSPNVAFELGIMQIQNKECLILRHESLPQVPFDLIKDLYRPYGRDLEVRNIVNAWASQIAESRLVRTDNIET